MVQQLGMAIVFVQDFQAAKDWYSKVLGLELDEVLDEGQWATFKFPDGGSILALHGGIPVAKLDRTTGAPPIVLGLKVTDIEKVVGELKDAGATFHKDLRVIQERLKAADILDPEGNLIQIYE